MSFLSGLFSSASDKDSRAGFWQSMLGGFGGNTLGLTANIMGLTQEDDPEDKEGDTLEDWNKKEETRAANRKRRAQTNAIATAANVAAIGGDVSGLVQNERNFKGDDYKHARRLGRAEGTFNFLSHAADAFGNGTAALDGFGVFGTHDAKDKDGNIIYNPDGTVKQESNVDAGKIKKYSGITSGALGGIGNILGGIKSISAYRSASRAEKAGRLTKEQASERRKSAVWSGVGTGFGLLGNIGKIVGNASNSKEGALAGKILGMIGQVGGMVTAARGVGHTARKKGAPAPRNRVASNTVPTGSNRDLDTSVATNNADLSDDSDDGDASEVSDTVVKRPSQEVVQEPEQVQGSRQPQVPPQVRVQEPPQVPPQVRAQEPPQVPPQVRVQEPPQVPPQEEVQEPEQSSSSSTSSTQQKSVLQLPLSGPKPEYIDDGRPPVKMELDE